ncbi:MAG: 3-keto-disaccharide hydrolase [Pirellula staleyi]
MIRIPKLSCALSLVALSVGLNRTALADIGVGAKPIAGAEMLLDGSREMLDQKWTYWQGPGFKSSMPIKWKIVDDPVDSGTAVMTDDPAAAGGKFGAADIVTKKEYRDFRLHVEFIVMNRRGNSGVYLQNRHEIQVMDGDNTPHGMGAIINEGESPYYAYNGLGSWNAYDIVFRAARFQDGKRVEKSRVTMYFNGQKASTNFDINQVWGGANSGIDGANDGGRGITDSPGGLKLQCEGHDVRYRNTWIKELELASPETDFSEPLSIESLIPKSETIQRPFNGNDLAGWNGDTSRWSAVKGMIRGANDDGVASSTYLFTQKKYRDFRMVLEVKQTLSPKHSTMHSAVAALGEQFTDVGENKFGFRGPLLMFCHDWGIWDAHRRNRVVPVGPGNEVEKKGEWNQIEILVVGDRIRMAANGRELFDFTDKSDMLQASSLGLQLHSNDKPQEYHFRNLLITESPATGLVTVRKK